MTTPLVFNGGEKSLPDTATCRLELSSRETERFPRCQADNMSIERKKTLLQPPLPPQAGFHGTLIIHTMIDHNNLIRFLSQRGSVTFYGEMIRNIEIEARNVRVCVFAQHSSTTFVAL